jgi:hypothetical protein
MSDLCHDASQRRSISHTLPYGSTGGDYEMSADQERQAMLGLALASRPNEEEIREEIFHGKGAEAEEPPRLEESLDVLTDLTNGIDGIDRQSHRLLALDLLAKVTARRGSSPLASVKEKLTSFAYAAVKEADRIERETGTVGDEGEEGAGDGAGGEDPSPPPPVELRVDQTVKAFLGVPQITPGPQPLEKHYWKAFTVLAAGPLNLTPSEIHRPLCTDDVEVPMPNELTAVRTAVWLWSERPARHFERWTDPRLWAADCGLFFRSVKPVGTGPSPTTREFQAKFTETVNVDGTNDLVTELVFSRTVDDARPGPAAPVLYALGFNLPDPPPKGPIVVDCGQVTVREDPLAPSGQRTLLLAEKYIRFADAKYQAWPTLACDTFWTEFAIVMAEGCRAN